MAGRASEATARTGDPEVVELRRRVRELEATLSRVRSAVEPNTGARQPRRERRPYRRTDGRTGWWVLLRLPDGRLAKRRAPGTSYAEALEFVRAEQERIDAAARAALEGAA